MQGNEFSSYAKIRNGVETVPADIRKTYHLDKLPHGLQRGRFFFESIISKNPLLQKSIFKDTLWSVKHRKYHILSPVSFLFIFLYFIFWLYCGILYLYESKQQKPVRCSKWRVLNRLQRNLKNI